MAEPARRAATYEDLLAVPDHKIAQIVNGELHVHPRPAGPHALCGSSLGGDLMGPFQRGRGGPGGWVIVFEPELHFGSNVLVPDLAGWRQERAPDFRNAFFTVAPDWVCEIHSPRSVKLDRGPKAETYAREGVAYLWFIDPEAQFVEAFQLENGRWVRLGVWSGTDVAPIPPFEAVPLELGLLWVPDEDPVTPDPGT